MEFYAKCVSCDMLDKDYYNARLEGQEAGPFVTVTESPEAFTPGKIYFIEIREATWRSA